MRYQDLKVGMRVKIVCACNDYHTDSDGLEWDNTWEAEMNNYVGEEFIIGSVRLTGIKPVVSDTKPGPQDYRWPWASLEEIVE